VEVDRDPTKFFTHWDGERRVFTLQLHFRKDAHAAAAGGAGAGGGGGGGGGGGRRADLGAVVYDAAGGAGDGAVGTGV
jgi:hypothetical protein